MAGLFEVPPLFDEEEPRPSSQIPEIPGLFGFDSSGNFSTDVTPEEQRTIDKEMKRVNEETAKRIEAIRDSGLLARYPVIESEEDEERERARLARRGLSPEEVDRRIAKFKRKGGKAKTSSKVMAAAGLLAGGIQGYLAAKQGRPIPMQGGLTQLRAQAQERIDREIAQVQQDAQEKKALILREDEREYTKALEEIKADLREQAKLQKEARDLGLDTRGMNVAQQFDAVTAEQARRGRRKEETEERVQSRLEETQESTQARARVTMASQLNDPSLASDRDLALFFEIDPKDKKKIQETRSRMESRARLRSIQSQQDILKKDIEIAAGEKRLDEPPKETPEEARAREAQHAYRESVGPAASAIQRFEGNEDKQKMILMQLVSQLRLANPDWSEQQLAEQVLKDIGDTISMARGLSMEQIQQFSQE